MDARFERNRPRAIRVTLHGWPCQIHMRWCRSALGKHRRAAVTMIELLCVIAIIGILASLLLPAVMSAYLRVTGMTDEWDAPDVARLLREATRRYCAANPRYQFDSKADLSSKCDFLPKCRKWVDPNRTGFVPFTFLDPTNLVVLTVHIGPNYRTEYTFTKGELSTRP